MRPDAPPPVDDDAPLGDRMRTWATGRTWWWRAMLFLFLAWQVMRGPLVEQGETTLWSGIIFGAHEFGHLFWAFAGEWMGIAGGSLTQLLVPLGAIALVWRGRDWFGVAVGLVFLAASLAELSWYIADARNEMLDLVSFSPDGAVHDWHYLLGSLGMLKRDIALSRLARAAAWLLLLAAGALTARLCLWMAAPRPATAR
ncbi:MAG: hypothetical protein K1X31_08200 [Gemmatimonadaceae bacterium]|nr:hypothetical protein [Gemmatimonadaceae bacterium]